jgi:hypothetical protein
MSGEVEVPPELKGRPWQEIRAMAREARAADWRRDHE